MAILGNIRKTSNTFVVVVVSFLVIMFLGSELVRIVPYFCSSKDQIGRLAGEKISYMAYRKSYDAVYHDCVRQGKQPTAEDQMRLKDYAWRQLIECMLYAKAIQQAGIAIGTQERIDLVQGDHIDAELIDFFKDPKTAAFDKQKLLTYLSNLSKSQQEGWYQIEEKLALKRARQKLHQLMLQSYFVTASEEAHAAQQTSLLCNVDYVYIPFTSVEDGLFQLTYQQLQDYMAAHKNHYTALSDSSTIKYIAFPIEPDEKDTSDFQKNMDSLLAQFATTTDVYAFAQQHTDGNLADTRLICTAGTLPNAFTTIKHTLKEGMVVGPIVHDAFHTLYKLVKVENDNYEIARIEKKPIASDPTRNKYFRQVQHLTAQVKKLVDLEKLADDQHLTIYKETVAPSDSSIGPYAAARKVVRWLYNEATVGKVSPLFDMGNAYLLAVMVDQVKAGDLLPLDAVYRKVYQKVLHQEKAKIILDRLKQIEATTLEGIAEQYGQGVAIQSVERLRFLKNDPPLHFKPKRASALENDSLPLKQAPAFVGKCFGLSLHSISDPIIDHTGIFIACVTHKDKEAIQEKYNEQMRKIERWMQGYYILGAMEELVKVTDERYKVE